MLNKDSINLLKECHSGVVMGISSYEDVAPRIKSKKLLGIVEENKKSHIQTQKEIKQLLFENGEEAKNPPAPASVMADITLNVKLAINEKDSQIAAILADGCSMGIKSLSKYKNQYSAAEKKAVTLTDNIIEMEETMHKALREFL